ncbi:MAG: hypothetical protein EA377_02450 [Phycisphaerales bacterium]|nr:MAG: hypothetical protein EA377_02450 [Phycisphaerales bacterium]
MIVDLHTQVWSSPDQLGNEIAERIRRRQTENWGQFDGNPAAHEQAMNCVDVAVVFGWRSQRLKAEVPNEFIADFVSRDPARRIGVAGIDPMAPDAEEQIEKAFELGLSGISVSPACQGFHPAHSDAMPLYEKCAEVGVPLFVMTGSPNPSSAMMEFARPSMWDEVARAFPTLPIVINQLGWPWIDETLGLIEKHDRVFADIAGIATRPWQLFNALLSASGVRVLEKLLFASGYPRDVPAKAIEVLYTVNSFSHGTQLPTVPRSQIRAIIERDALSLLGIDHDGAAERSDGIYGVQEEKLPALAAGEDSES